MMNASAVPVPAWTRIDPPLTSTDTPGDSTDRVRMMTPKPDSDRVKAGGCVVRGVCCSDMKRPLSSRDDHGVINYVTPELRLGPLVITDRRRHRILHDPRPLPSTSTIRTIIA